MSTVTQICHRALIALATFMLALVVTPDPGRAQESGRVLVTEIFYDTPGVDADQEWVELANIGDLPIDLDGLKLGDEEQPGGGEGMTRFPPGAVLSAGEVVIVAQTATGFRALYGFNPAFEWQASDDAIPDMLPYETWAKGEVALNNDGDELLLLNGDDVVVDAVSYGASPTFLSPSVPGVFRGQSLERVPADCDRNIASDWQVQQYPTPGTIRFQGDCPEPSPDEIAQLPVPIGAIQGSGDRSPRLNQTVTFEGVVTGILEDRNTRGAVFYTIFVQDAPGREDSLASTSDAIAVFHGPRRPPYLPGDTIRVRGQVTEFFGLTEIDDRGLQIELISPDQPLPGAIQLQVAGDATAQPYERLESMLVALPESVVLGPTFSGCGFSVMPGVTPGRSIRRRVTDPAGPLMPILHHSDVNCGDFPQVKVGDVVAGLRGPLTYHFDQFKIVTQDAHKLQVTPAPIPAAPVAPRPDADQAVVATFNLHDYFDPDKNAGRDQEPLPSPQEVELKQFKLAQTISTVLGCPALVAVQEVENEPLLQELARRLEPACGFQYEVAHRESPDARGIDLGLLRHPDRTSLIQISARQHCSPVTTVVFDPSISCPAGHYPLFSRPPLRVDLTLDGMPYTVVVTHFKSKREGEAETAPQRLAQAGAVSAMVDQVLSQDPEAWIIVLGDFNDYEDSDVLRALTTESAGLINATGEVPAPDRYTYNFGGVSQLLDAVLVSPNLAPRVVSSHILHVNADYPAGWSADTQNLFRSSDHDIPLIVLDTAQPVDIPAEPTPTSSMLADDASTPVAISGVPNQMSETSSVAENRAHFAGIALGLLGAAAVLFIIITFRRR